MLTTEYFAARLAQANLASKTDIANFIKKTNFDDKLKKLNKKFTSNETKHVFVENKLKKLQTLDSSLFTDQSYFNNNGAQLYLIFQPTDKTITTFSSLSDTISEWESKGLSNEKFKPPYTANKILSAKLMWYNSRIKLKFKGSSFKQEDNTAYTPKNMVNLFIVYELDTWSPDLNTEFTIKDCLEL